MGQKNENKNKEIAMMRGKSPPSEHILEKIKSNNALGFKGDNNQFLKYS